MIIRRTFPRVNRWERDGKPLWLVDGRKHGFDRKTFSNEKDALDHASHIAKQLELKGAQPEVPPDVKLRADAYSTLLNRLAEYGKRPEDAVDHYIKFLASEIIRLKKPTVAEMVDGFQKYKLMDKVDEQYQNEIKVHCRFIKRTWGEKRIDDVRKNEIEATLIKAYSNRNTRRKYLTFVRMFFKWVLGEDKGHILTNPADGIRFKAENFEKEHYSPEETKSFLKYVAEHHKHLVGYYALLTFAGLRPTEGARVTWDHINLDNGSLHVIKGKTDARHPQLEPVAVEWLKWHRENSPKDAPLVPKKNMPNLEREVREGFRKENKDKWIADGLRHTFATYFRALKKSDNEPAWYMGNSPAMIRKHYAKSIPHSELDKFWKLTPDAVMG